VSRPDVLALEAQRIDGAASAVLESADDVLPSWFLPVVAMARDVTVLDLTRFPPPESGGRASSVLVLFGVDDEGHPDVLLIERAHDMRSHSGQPAFPGGALDPEDSGVVAAALREAVEETGLDADGVVPFAVLPDLYLPPSGFVVSPVLAWWREPSNVYAVDAREVASVLRVAWRDLADPERRVRVQHPSGFVGPGFGVDGPNGDLMVWGFTAGLIDRILDLTGWAEPWDEGRVLPLDETVLGRDRRST
jgi:8-oxo-dGTP pyrophosphatase MutT (NUDIX family)